MAEIHRTTMTPTKLELLSRWLPHQAWYIGGPWPRLATAGGFRLDDPAGRVGIECYFVADISDDVPVVYHVPTAYRGGPSLAGEEALIGTSEHGVLGTRWIYDGAADPIVRSQIRALLRGDVAPQHQKDSDSVDDTVTVAAGDVPVDAALTVVRLLAARGHSHSETPQPCLCRAEATWAIPTGAAGRAVVAFATSA